MVRVYFNGSPWKTYRRWLVNLLLFVASLFYREVYHYAKNLVVPYVQRIFHQPNKKPAD